MSGPKIDQAELDRLQKEELELERQERVRQIKLATDQLNLARDSISLLAYQIEHAYQGEILQVEGQDEMAMTLNQIKAIKEKYEEQLTFALQLPYATEAHEIQEVALRLRQIQENTKAAFKSETQSDFLRIREFIKSKIEFNDLKSYSEKLSHYETERMDFADFEFGKPGSSDQPTTRPLSSNRDKVKTVLTEIKDLLSIGQIYRPDQALLLKFARDIQMAATQGDQAWTKVVAEYEIARSGFIKNRQLFTELYQEYLSEFMVYMDLTNLNLQDKLPIRPAEKSSFRNMNHLEEELAKTRLLSIRQNERNYIRSQLNEVMQLFEFDLCQEIVFDPDQKGNHYLSRLSGGETAIHIYLSDSKQMMMEIVGVQPQGSESETGTSAYIEESDRMDSSEKAILLAQQGQFCHIHPQITQALRDRGIRLNTKAHHKEDVKYCKKIVQTVTDESSGSMRSRQEAHPPIAKQKKTKKMAASN